MNAVVFGAVRPPGIGSAVARRLAAAGTAVACVEYLSTEGTFGASEAALRSLADEIAAVAIPVRDPESMAGAVDVAARQLGPIRLGANFSGGTGPGAGNGALLDLDDDAWEQAMSVNLTSTWRINRALAAHMVHHGQGGAIVNLSSYATRHPKPGFGAFAVAKAGVQMLTRVLAREVAPYGIRVNAVAPLGVAGPNPGLAATSWDIPMGRLQSPDEVAAVAVHLLSEDASFVTGETVYVSGGT